MLLAMRNGVELDFVVEFTFAPLFTRSGKEREGGGRRQSYSKTGFFDGARDSSDCLSCVSGANSED